MRCALAPSNDRSSSTHRRSSSSRIAADLVITEQTVKGHVSNILSKLHLADRTQAAVYAWREGVVGDESD
jgi:DNA-binding CsgD family transcriptional regulator